MAQHDTQTTWMDAAEMASDALALAKKTAAVQRAQNHLIMLMLAAFAKTAPAGAVSQLIDEIERIRDLSGPAGNAAGEVFAAAASTLERLSRSD